MKSEITIECEPESYRFRIIDFLNQFSTAVILDSNTVFNSPVPVTGRSYDFIAAAGVFEEITGDGISLDQLQLFLNKHQENKNWVFGFLTYDVKNEIENLRSSHASFVSFPKIHFFVPQHIFIAKNNSIKIISNDSDPALLWKQLNSLTLTDTTYNKVKITYVQQRESYLQAVKNILSHIRHGDIYELNFCHEVRLKATAFHGTELFKKLLSISPNPFSAYYKTGARQLLCASPERFVMKNGAKIYSQPIKGTAERSDDPALDNQYKDFLRQNEKECSENVMIVDLVRNDLSKIAKKASVKVEELFGIYTFKKVHQMISTISCSVEPDVTFSDIIRAAFPMGSMTGAPKVNAMHLIEKYENFRRGLFSGTVGYIDPEGNFDFNVVIRSILCNGQTGDISIAAGGAITAESNPEKEYHETLIKIAPQLAALGLTVNELIDFNDTVSHV